MGQLKPFLWCALGWLVLGTLLSLALSSGEAKLSIAWFLCFWGLSVFDLFALTKVVSTLLILAAGDEKSVEKRPALIIQSFYWGFLKIGCLGAFGVVLFLGSSISRGAMLLGLGTLIIVPLFGGFLWSQRVLKHA
ncbi:hypothetical protein WDW86_14560 [Bdellovibrionota bacterium FG-2]